MIAFIFPGQGSQAVGMGKSLADRFPECREVFDEADAALGERLSNLIFEGPAETLTLTENTQPAILTTSIAACRALASQGITPDIVAGHSLGEYSAHVAAGIGARELLLTGGTAGVLDGDGRTIASLTPAEAEALMQDGTASAGMIAKLRAALTARARGVAEVAIVEGRSAAAIAERRGTRIT